MSLLLPSPSNSYAVTVNFKISDAVWNAAIPHLAGRVEELEDIVAAGYTAAQQAGTAMAEAIIQDAVAPQIADINETIAGFQTAISLAEDQLAALQNGGVEAENVPLAPYGIFAPGTDAQEAFNLLSDAVEAFDENIEQLATDKMDKTALGAALGVAPLDAGQKVPDANINGDTLKVGDILRSTRLATPSGFLRADGAKYLKSAYPDLFPAIPKQMLWDANTGSISTGFTDYASSFAFCGGDFAITVGANVGVLLNMKTGVFSSFTLPGASTNYTFYAAAYVDGLFYILLFYSSTTLTFTLNPLNGVVATVANNLPTNPARRIARHNGFWFALHGGVLYRGAALNSMAIVVGAPTQIYDVGEPNAEGRMYLLSGPSTSAPTLFRSTDYGASWSSVGLLTAGGITPAYGTGGPSILGNNRFVQRFGGFTYLRTKQASGNSQGHVFRVADNDVPEHLFLGTQAADTNGSFFYEMNDFVYVGRGADGILYEKETGKVVDATQDQISLALGFPLTLLTGDTSYVLHKDYGRAQLQRTTTISRWYSPHDYDTEFRVPRIQSLYDKAYIKAAA